jgi:uncharacterized protein (DUF488 family)
MIAVIPNATVFTIGHSTHSLEKFVQLLQLHSIGAVADVRSAPYSRFNPQYNKATLEGSLKSFGVKYVFLGRELGARSDDPSAYEHGRVQYKRLAQAPGFRAGIERVERGAREHRIALMCAEREPLECHRTLLVARALHESGVEVQHILASGKLEAHSHAMLRLLDLTGLPREDLFRSEGELIDEAIARQEAKVAYVDEHLSEDKSEL